MATGTQSIHAHAVKVFSYRPNPTVIAIIRVGLASLLTMIICFQLPLPHPYWGLLTVAFLGMQTDLGSLRAKAFGRLAGTVAGGAVGALLVINFSQMPWLMVTLLAIWVGFCTVFTGIMQNMLGYAGFLSALTALLVVVFNIDQPNTYQIFYYTIYRVSEIAVGVFSIMLCTALIFPTSSRLHLRNLLTKFQNDIERQVHAASNPQEEPLGQFVKRHEALCRRIVMLNTQRFYTSQLDRRLARVSGGIERVLFEQLSVLSTLLLVRRYQIKKDHETDETQLPGSVSNTSESMLNALNGKVQTGRRHLSALIDTLNDHDKLMSLPTELADDKTIRAWSLREAFYCGFAVFTTVLACFSLWVASENPYGQIMIVAGVIQLLIRVTFLKHRLRILDIMMTVVHIAVVIFIIQFVIMTHLTELWSFYLVYMVALSYILVGAMSSLKTAFWVRGVIFFSLLLPVENPMSYDAIALINQAVSSLCGLLVAFLVLKIIATPPAKALIGDHITKINKLISQVLNNPNSITEQQFRKPMVTYHMDLIYLDQASQRETIVTWFSAVTTMYVNYLDLKKQVLDEEASLLFARIEQQLRKVAGAIVYPGHASQPFQNSELEKLTALVEDCESFLSQRTKNNELGLLRLADALRLYYLVIYERETELLQ